MLDDSLRRLIDREVHESDALLEMSKDIREIDAGSEPGFERLAALSQVLNSFYTAVERILMRILEGEGEGLPTGERWHAELLIVAGAAQQTRPAVPSEDLQPLLQEYLAFRHRSRHAYVHHLEWTRMAHLVAGLPDCWHRVRKDIRAYLRDG
jgi:hypothetical protein